MIWLAVSRVHDISRMGDHMIHILTLLNTKEVTVFSVCSLK